MSSLPPPPLLPAPVNAACFLVSDDPASIERYWTALLAGLRGRKRAQAIRRYHKLLELRRDYDAVTRRMAELTDRMEGMYPK